MQEEENEDLQPYEMITQDELPIGYTVDPHGIVRNEYGQFVKHYALPPQVRERAKTAHRKFKKNTDLRKMLDQEFGPKCVSIMDLLGNIVFYDQARSKHKWAEWKSAERLKAIELVLAYRYGRPSTHKSIDQKIDVKYDAKISVINELIEKNKDKIKLIVDNTVQDAEFEEQQPEEEEITYDRITDIIE